MGAGCVSPPRGLFSSAAPAQAGLRLSVPCAHSPHCAHGLWVSCRHTQPWALLSLARRSPAHSGQGTGCWQSRGVVGRGLLGPSTWRHAWVRVPVWAALCACPPRLSLPTRAAVAAVLSCKQLSQHNSFFPQILPRSPSMTRMVRRQEPAPAPVTVLWGVLGGSRVQVALWFTVMPPRCIG